MTTPAHDQSTLQPEPALLSPLGVQQLGESPEDDPEPPTPPFLPPATSAARCAPPLMLHAVSQQRSKDGHFAAA
jgi:hypothetical protein